MLQSGLLKKVGTILQTKRNIHKTVGKWYGTVCSGWHPSRKFKRYLSAKGEYQEHEKIDSDIDEKEL